MSTTISPPTAASSAPPLDDAASSPSAMRLARHAALGAAVIGLTGDLLLREGGFGRLGLSLFLVIGIVTLALLGRVRRTPWTLGACLLLVPTLWFTLSFAWRDSPALVFLNLLGLLTALVALATALARGEEWEPASGVGAYLWSAVRVVRQSLFGAPRLLRASGALRDARASSPSHPVGAALRGAVIALPLLFVFGSLLTSADAQFDRLVRRLFDVDFDAIVGHTVLTLALGWLAAGYLRSALFPPAPSSASVPRYHLSLGVVEVAVALASLDLLFGSFVFVQLRYFFGGSEHVMTTARMTYAEYARRGFFELVCVSALSLPTLLALDGLFRRRGVRDERVFRLLAGLLIALLGVVMLSAVQRMRLYQQTYGWTESRFYANAAMGWIAIVLAWFAATVLRGRRAPFAFGALVAAWGMVMALDLANPDAMIARTNVERMRRGDRFDPAYVTRLSDDATPALVDVVGQIEQPYGCSLARKMLRTTEPGGDLRRYNVARAAASRAVRARMKDVTSAADCPGATTARARLNAGR